MVIPLDSVELRGAFYGADIAPPLLVIYAEGDKKCLTDLFLSRIVDPILCAEIPQLVARDAQHM